MSIASPTGWACGWNREATITGGLAPRRIAIADPVRILPTRYIQQGQALGRALSDRGIEADGRDGGGWVNGNAGGGSGSVVVPSVARTYDRWAATYERRWRHYTDVTLGVLLDHLAPDRYRAILDVGCGTGTLLARLHDRAPWAHLWGIDVSAGMLGVARATLRGVDVDLWHGTASHLPLADRSVDLVTMASMLHYLRRPSVACAEARRVLRPGGVLAIVDYRPRVGAGSVTDGLIRLYDRGHVRSRDVREAHAILGAAGLAVTHMHSFAIDRICAGILVMAASSPQS